MGVVLLQAGFMNMGVRVGDAVMGVLVLVLDVAVLMRRVGVGVFGLAVGVGVCVGLHTATLGTCRDRRSMLR